MGKLLSICIPTYNREPYLKRLIDSIVSQEWFSDEIEIVINDWPSKDNTEQVVKEYQKKYKNIRYYRNNKAIGMLPAILESINMSNWIYTWLFGSDDFMQKDALKIVKETIKSGSPTLILSNRFDFEDIEECYTYMPPKKNILFFNGFSDFSTYLGLEEREKEWDKHNYFTFMSVFCFETEYYQKMYKYILDNVCEKAKLDKHYFNYVVILFSQLFSWKKIAIVESPRLVFCKVDNHWWRYNRKIIKDIKMLTTYIKKNYIISPNCKKLFKKFVFTWWFSYYITLPVKHIGIYKPLSKFWRKNILKK